MHLVDEPPTGVRKDVAQLFRAEALEHYQRGADDEAHVLELEPKWTRYTSRVILALFAAALLFAALVHVDRYVDGVGVVRGARLIAYLPARHQAKLRPSMPLRFEYSGRMLAVDTVGRQIVAGPAGPAVVVEAKIDPKRLGEGVAGRVRVRVGRERLLTLLVPWSRRG